MVSRRFFFDFAYKNNFLHYLPGKKKKKIDFLPVAKFTNLLTAKLIAYLPTAKFTACLPGAKKLTAYPAQNTILTRRKIYCFTTTTYGPIHPKIPLLIRTITSRRLEILTYEMYG